LQFKNELEAVRLTDISNISNLLEARIGNYCTLFAGYC